MANEPLLEEMTRDQLEQALMWNAGGAGFGICAVGNMLDWAFDAPGPNKPDLRSIVAISGQPGDYTDEELRLLLEFSRRKTADYDRYWNVRRGANLVCIGKSTMGGQTRWLRKRLSWDRGAMHSPTLEEALAIMERA